MTNFLLNGPAGLPGHLSVGHVAPLVREGLALGDQLRPELGHLYRLALCLLHLLAFLPLLLLKVGHFAGFRCELTTLWKGVLYSERKNNQQPEHLRPNHPSEIS